MHAGHVHAPDYGWGWFERCLEAVAKEEAAAHAKLVIGMAVAARGGKTLERYLREQE